MLSAQTSASAGERIAVLVFSVHEGDGALADNLTEVAISKLAETSSYELVGTRELRGRLAKTGGGDLPGDCLSQPSCLGRIGLLLGVRRVVGGNVRAEESRFLVALALNDIQSGKAERTFFRAVDGGLDSVIRAIQAGVEDLFQPRAKAGQVRIDSAPDGAVVVLDERYQGTTPVWLSAVEPGGHRLRIEMNGRFPWKNEISLAPGQSLLVSINRDDLVARRTWAPYVVYGTAAVAVLSFAAAGIFGTLARADPTGPTRGDTQKDLELRKTYATITNTLLVGGAGLSGVSVFTFLRFRRDIAGE